MKKTLAIVGLALVLSGCGMGRGYSTGERVGVIQKFSNKGLVWKSWEGEMVLSSFSKTEDGAMYVDKFYFSVNPENKELVAKINAAVESGKKAKLSYSQCVISPLDQDTSYEAVGCEVIQ